MEGKGIGHKVGLMIACALAILAPVPFGSTHPLVLVCLALLLGAALVMVWLDRDQLSRPPARFAWLALACVGLALFQLLPLPPALISTLSPRLAKEATASLAFPGANAELVDTERALAQLAGGERPEERWHPLAVDPDGGLDGALRLTIAFAAFFVGLLSIRSSRDRRLLVGAIALSAFLQAIYGLAESLSGNFHILYLARTHYIPLASGTFICPNHFAALLSLGLFCLLGLLTELWLHGTDTVSDRAAKTALGGTAAGVILLAMIWSSSRAGLAAAAVGLVFFAAVALFRLKQKHSRMAGGLVIGLLLVTLVSGATWIRPPEPLANDVGDVSLDIGGRIGIWQSTLEIVRAFPILGSGVGTYRYVHPFFRHAETPTRTLHSHSDYFEWISDTGLVGLPLLIAWLLALGYGAVIVTKRKRGLALTLAISAAMLALAIHETVDFSLQLSGVAIPALLLAGAWLTPLSWGPQQRHSRDPGAWARSTVILAALLLGLSSLTLWNLRPLPVRPEGPPRLAAESNHTRRWARGVISEVLAQWRSDKGSTQSAARPLGAAMLALQSAAQRSPLRGDLRLSLWLASQSLVAIDPARSGVPKNLVPLTRHYLDRAETLAPFDRQRRFVVAKTWMRAGNPAEARRVVRELLAMAPEKAKEAYQILGGETLSLADLMEATPNTPLAAIHLSRYLATTNKDYVGSQIVLERALARYPEHWRLRSTTAFRMANRGRLQQALEVLDAGDAEGPGDPQERRSYDEARALTYSGLGMVEALEDLVPVLKSDGTQPTKIDYYYGRALYKAGQEPEAAAAFSRALDPRLEPLREGERLNALVFLGVIARNNHHYQEALSYFNRAAEIRPDHPQVKSFFQQLERTLR